MVYDVVCTGMGDICSLWSVDDVLSTGFRDMFVYFMTSHIYVLFVYLNDWHVVVGCYESKSAHATLNIM